MQFKQHKQIWQCLRKLALELGGCVIYVYDRGLRGYQLAAKNPADASFAVDWGAKTIYCTYQPDKWPRLLHEMAHVFASHQVPRDMESDYSLLGWEFAALSLLSKQLELPYENIAEYWLDAYGTREIDLEDSSGYYADLAELRYDGPRNAVSIFATKQIDAAKYEKRVAPTGHLLSCRA